MAMSTKDLASEIGVSPRELRKFLRHSGLGVGQGSRYDFDSKDVQRISKRFSSWKSDKTKAVVIPDSWNEDENS